MTQAALAAYGEVKVHSAIEGASPTELISMLFDGVSSRLNQSLTAMEAGEIAGRRWNHQPDYQHS